jgi:glycosyltransferase involved in cell wall biosynthesis
MQLGFACFWDENPKNTWSHTPWSLRGALRAHADLVDVGVRMSPALRLSLKALHARRHNDNWVSMWKHSGAATRYCENAVRRNTRALPHDVTVQIQDLAILSTPYLVLQDLSYDLLLDEAEGIGRSIQFATLGRDRIKKLRDRQLRVYENAAGVLAMSHWFAEHLVRVSGVPSDRVHVVNPGASALSAAPRSPAATRRRVTDRPRRRLLFVGRDFARKGGHQVLAALAILRAEVDPRITLTVVGPATWPLPGEPPAGVRFLGVLPVAQVADVYDEHDVFVLPSRFEAFGIALAEALTRGLPCVARRAFAMPEIVRHGDNGELVDSDDPGELAGALARVLADRSLFRRVADQTTDARRHYSWDRAAGDILAIADKVA